MEKLKPSETLPEEIREELRDEAWDLHVQGFSYRAIAKKLGNKVSHVNIYKWIRADKRFLADRRSEETTADMREAVAAQLDIIIKSGMRDVDSDQRVEIEVDPLDPTKTTKKFVNKINPDATKAVMEAIKIKNKLFGINAPEKKEIKVEFTLGDLLGLAGKADVEEILDGEFEEVKE